MPAEFGGLIKLYLLHIGSPGNQTFPLQAGIGRVMAAKSYQLKRKAENTDIGSSPRIA
jgi:hypothetical protein